MYIITRLTYLLFSKMNAPTHWLPFYSQMLKMQQKLTTKIDPTYRNIFWTEKKESLKTQEVSHHM
jgi:hypothetical protein